MASLRLYLRLVGLSYLCTLRVTECARNSRNNIRWARVIGGTATTVDELNYIVYLRFGNQSGCAGTLVSPTHVVTAAHCVANLNGAALPASLYTVHGGTTYLNDDGVVRKVKNIAIPGNYKKRDKLSYDIAVLTLASPMTGTNIATIPLCSRSIPVGAAVRVSGWGITQAGGSFSNQLRTVMLNMISKKKCRQSFAKGAITSTMICAGKRGKGHCTGDSGGPLVYKGELCGVVSRGKECVTGRYPGLYTSINFMKSFIRNNMK